MLDTAQTFLQLLIRKLICCDRNRIVWHVKDAAGLKTLQQRSRPLYVSGQDIQNGSSHGCLYRVWRLVCSNTNGDAARRMLCIETYRCFYLFWIKFADLTGMLQRIGFCLFPQHLISCLVGSSFPCKGSLQCRIKAVIPRIFHWFRAVCFCIPYHKDVRGLRIIAFFCSPEHLRLCVYQIRKVRPFQDKFFIVELLLHDISDPCQHQGYVGARTDRQPDVCFRRIRGQSRINDNGFYTFCTEICHRTATACRAGVRRICAP